MVSGCSLASVALLRLTKWTPARSAISSNVMGATTALGSQGDRWR
jgi:hypothetical protein